MFAMVAPTPVVAVDSAVAATQVSSHTTPRDTLKGTAIATAKAWLTGTADDIMRYEGPACGPKQRADVTPAKAAAALKELRAPLESLVGRPLKTVKIRGVRVRNVTASSGEAEVEYNLPASVAGTYKLGDLQEVWRSMESRRLPSPHRWQCPDGYTCDNGSMSELGRTRDRGRLA